MTARPATFGGWGYPEIPAGARLATVAAQVAVPAANASASMDGTSPLGGTGFLVSRRALERGQSRRVRLVAASFGLYDFQRTYSGTASIAAGGSATLDSLLGWGAGPHAFSELRIGAGGAGAFLRLDGATNASPIPTAPTILQNGSTVALSDISNPSGGAISVYVTATKAPSAWRSEVQVYVRRVEVTPGGTVVGTASQVGPGLAHLWIPQPLPMGGEALLEPVVPDPTFAELAAGEAFAVQVTHIAGGRLPASARVLARLLVAYWPEGGE